VDELDELERRLERLEARAGIRDLLTRYGRAIDERDLDTFVPLFTPDALFTFKDRMMKSEGAAAIRATFTGVFNLIPPSCHWTHGHFITFDENNPGLARGLVLAHSETVREGVPFLSALHYDDIYRRHQGQWKFAQRILSFLYFVPAKDYTEALTSPLRMRVTGNPRQADFPETLPSWQAFAASTR
jgi:ketosteroid isomerase-like protein